MNAATAVTMMIIGFETVLAWILIEFMSRALDMSPTMAILRGLAIVMKRIVRTLEVLAFMIVATFPAPTRRPVSVPARGPRHRLA